MMMMRMVMMNIYKTNMCHKRVTLIRVVLYYDDGNDDDDDL